MTSITTKTEDGVNIVIITGKVGFDTIEKLIVDNLDSWVGAPDLWDLTGMDFSEVSSDKVRTFTYRMLGSLKDQVGKTAFVAPEDVQFGMVRVFKAFAENVKIKVHFEVFRRLEDAKKWLLEDLKNGSNEENP